MQSASMRWAIARNVPPLAVDTRKHPAHIEYIGQFDS
jgi:hypothetical protein